MRPRAGLAVLLLWGTSCASLGGVSDGTSLSFGATNGGELVNATQLPVRGAGYLVPRAWATRGLNWGTEELVGLIVRSSRRLSEDSPGPPLYIGDLSPRRGGASAWHRSHQSGRDADLIYFAVDEKGRPAPAPEAMIAFGPDGATPEVDARGQKIPRLFFDTARNWRLVKALLDDPVVEVQFLFIFTPLKRMLLDYATAQGEPPELIERADALLIQPGDSLPHNDHLHVRIYCPVGDRSLGCRERGPLRWLKKLYKYGGGGGWHARQLPPEVVAEAVGTLRPLCRLLAGSLFARL